MLPIAPLSLIPDPQGRAEGSQKPFFEVEKSGGIAYYRPIAKTAGKETEDLIVNAIKRIEAEGGGLEETTVTSRPP